MWRKLIGETWDEVQMVAQKAQKKSGAASESTSQEDSGAGQGKKQQKQAPKKGFFSSIFGGTKATEGKENGHEDASSDKKGGGSNAKQTWNIPQTFEEMCTLNATMMGANLAYVKIMQQCINTLIAAVRQGDDARLELECTIISHRMHCDVREKVDLANFKVIMLSSLRSLLPKSWSIAVEQAWMKMWDLIQGFLETHMPLPLKYERAVTKFVLDISSDKGNLFGVRAFNRLFQTDKQAEDAFIISNSRMNQLVFLGLVKAMEMYREPARQYDDTIGLGLKHIMYNIPVEFFEPFVCAIIEELKETTTDALAIEGIEYTLTTIATIMVYTIKEGSSDLLKAIVANSPKMIKKALAPLPRGQRAGACLDGGAVSL